jgi:hypothetical protein
VCSIQNKSLDVLELVLQEIDLVIRDGKEDKRDKLQFSEDVLLET